MLKIRMSLRRDSFDYEGTDPFEHVVSLIEKWFVVASRVDALTQRQVDDLVQRMKTSSDRLTNSVDAASAAPDPPA